MTRTVRACPDAGCAGGTDARRASLASELAAQARTRGFALCGCAPAASLYVNPAVRSLCAEDRCRSYGRNWTCPPACGTLDDFAAALAARAVALVVQTVEQLEDEFDIEGMMATERVHKERFAALVTDGLRAQYLESVGYETQILEFIDMEHTPKNLLIRAVKQGKRKENREAIEAILKEIHAEPTLYRLLMEEK